MQENIRTLDGVYSGRINVTDVNMWRLYRRFRYFSDTVGQLLNTSVTWADLLADAGVDGAYGWDTESMRKRFSDSFIMSRYGYF